MEFFWSLGDYLDGSISWAPLPLATCKWVRGTEVGFPANFCASACSSLSLLLYFSLSLCLPLPLFFTFCTFCGEQSVKNAFSIISFCANMNFAFAFVMSALTHTHLHSYTHTFTHRLIVVPSRSSTQLKTHKKYAYKKVAYEKMRETSKKRSQK